MDLKEALENILKQLEAVEETASNELPETITLTKEEAETIVDYLVKMSNNIHECRSTVNKLMSTLEEEHIKLCHNLLSIMDGAED